MGVIIHSKSGGQIHYATTLSRAGKLVYHTSTEPVTTETVIEAFDQFVAQKDPDTFAIVVLDNASMHRSKAFRRKIMEWMSHRVHLVRIPGHRDRPFRSIVTDHSGPT